MDLEKLQKNILETEENEKELKKRTDSWDHNKLHEIVRKEAQRANLIIRHFRHRQT